MGFLDSIVKSLRSIFGGGQKKPHKPAGLFGAPKKPAQRQARPRRTPSEMINIELRSFERPRSPRARENVSDEAESEEAPYYGELAEEIKETGFREEPEPAVRGKKAGAMVKRLKSAAKRGSAKKAFARGKKANVKFVKMRAVKPVRAGAAKAPAREPVGAAQPAVQSRAAAMRVIREAKEAAAHAGPGAGPPVAEIERFRASVRKLKKEVAGLKREVLRQKIAPRDALGGVQSIYGDITSKSSDIDGEMKRTKSLIDFLESSFLTRKIDERAFREKMQDYNEKLHLLSFQKKELEEQKGDLGQAAEKIPTRVPVDLQTIARTKDLESLLVKQGEILEKLADRQGSGQPIHLSISPGVTVTKGGKPQKGGEPLEIRQGEGGAGAKPGSGGAGQARGGDGGKGLFGGIFAKKPQGEGRRQAAPGADELKAAALKAMPEAKSGDVAAKGDGDKIIARAPQQGIGIFGGREARPEKKMADVPMGEPLRAGEGDKGHGEMMQSMNRLLNVLEADKSMKKSERIETAMKVMEPTAKRGEDAKGVETEIKKNVIVTDFDRVYTLVMNKGRITTGDISRELGIPKAKVEECCQVLKREKQVDIAYMALGDPVIEAPDYRMRLEMERLKKKQEKTKGEKNG